MLAGDVGNSVVQFGLRANRIKWEIPLTSLRAGSSLRLKNGCSQDDAVERKKPAEHRPNFHLHSYSNPNLAIACSGLN